MKLKYKHSRLMLSSFSIMVLANIFTSFAVNIDPYTLKGSNPQLSSTSSPPAYIISGSEYFPDGTILYKQSYNDVTYYSPKPPAGSEEETTVSAQYKNWGFWDFSPNRERNSSVTANYVFRSNEYYSEAVVTKQAVAYGCDYKGSQNKTGTTLKVGTKLKVKSITIQDDGTEYLYFDTRGTGVSSFNNIGRINTKYVTKSSNDEVKVLYYNEIKDRSNPCSAYYDNFKKYKTVAQRYFGSAHDQLELSDTIVPSNVTTCSLGGKRGEWKYLGLSSTGNKVVNPYYPGDKVSFLGNGSLAYYDWRKTPWDSSDPESEERGTVTNQSTRAQLIYNDAQSFRNLYNAPTFFDANYKEKKIEILQKVINDGVQPVNGNNRETLTARQWAERLSLLTNPYDETPIFVGQRRAGDYSQPFAYIKPTNDLFLSQIIIKDYYNNTVAYGNRTAYDKDFNYTVIQKLKKGGYYTIEVKLSKKIDEPLKASSLSSEIKITDSNNNNVKYLPYSKKTLLNKGGLTYRNNTSNTMIFGFNVPEDYTGSYYIIDAFVSKDHTGIDNLIFSNDSGQIKVDVDPNPYEIESGDIKAVSIKLLDGNTVVYNSQYPSSKKAIVPGKKYDILYTAQYTDESLYYKKFNGTKWVNDTSNPYKSKVPLSYFISRKVGNTQSEDSVLKYGYFKDSNNNENIAMLKNTLFTFSVKDVILEHPYLETEFKITSTNKKINKNTYNDSISARLNDTFDIVISNLRVLPSKEFLLNNTRNISYTVIYDAKLTAPSYITSNNYKTLVDTSINVNGTQGTFVDLLKPNTVTKNISHTISGVPAYSTSGPYYCEVILNYNRKVYENGDYNNNKAITQVTFEKVKNPTLGNINDVAKKPYNGANSSPNKGGDANNNCLIPRNTNTYNSSYTIYNWNTTNISYNSFSGNNNINFYKYNITSEQSKTTQNTENFVIKDILFRSKYTKDKNLGDKKDGWVSMINSKDSIIKAGYGFELKVIVEYKTNAMLNNPVETNNITNGTFVTNLNGGINITPEIFIEIPGDNNRVILSSTKHEGTKQGLVVKQTKDNVIENSMQVSEWEFTLKETTFNGVKEVEKIFIPENLKDGNYKISIYTPPISGVSSLSEYNTFKYSSLCDRKDTSVTVKGSATDDLNSHITQ